MKRTSKILILVLSLALVLGAVAMVASATASDVTVKKTANFESKDVGLLGTASDGKNPDGGNITFQQGGRTGRVDIVKGTDGNKYALVTQTDKVGKSGPYAYMGTGGNASIGSDGVIVPGSNDFSNYKYLVYEIDMMSPTGKFSTGSLDPSARAFKEGATGRDFWNTNANQNIVQFGTDSKGSFLSSSAVSEKMYVNPYEFNHVQIILENTTKEGDTNIGLTSYVYVNGELWFSKVASNVPTSYHSGIPHAAFIEFKVNYSTADDPSLTLAIDNVKFSTVPAGSETAVEELLTYDADNRPAGNAIAKVGDVEYTDLADAIAQAPVGGTITLLNNLYNTVTVGKVVNIEAGEYTLSNLKAATGYSIVKEGTTYKVGGITVIKSEDAQDMADGWGKVGSFDTTKFAYSVSNNSFGTTSLGKDSTGNQYIVFAPVGGTEGKDVYPGTGYGGIGSTINKKRPTITEGVLDYAGSIEFFPYLVQDIEVAAPSGKFATLAIGLQGRYMDANGSLQSWNGSAAITVMSDSTGSYVTSGNNKVYVNPYEFTHITYIVEGVTTDTYCYANFYVYVNGEYLNSVLVSPTQAGKSYYKNIPHWTVDEIRFGLGGDKKEHTDRDIAIDNMTTRIFTPEYAELGGLAEILKAKSSLSAWEYDLNDDSKKPIIPVATIGEVEYTDFQAAFDAVEDGETINILKNALTPVVINAPFANVTVNKGDYTLELVAGNGMELTNDGDVYTAKELAPKLFVYEKNGAVTYGIGTLKEAIADADAGSTVKLLADVTIKTTTNKEYIDIGKKLTIDLNGYTLKHITEGVKNKCSLFRMTGGTDLTITSSQKGGKIFNEGWNSETGVGAAGMFTWPNDSAILRINGNGPDGTPYLSIFTGNMIQAYSNAAEYYIDGGMFICVRSDQQGMIDVRKAGRDAEVKNAIFYVASNVFGYGGRNIATDNDCNIVMDNCVVIGNLVNDLVDPVVLTVTNTYITGTVKPLVSTYKQASHAADGKEIPTADRKNNTVGNVILGEGVYVDGDISEDVAIADGYMLYVDDVTKEFTYDLNKWAAAADYTFADSSFVPFSETKEYSFTKVVDKIGITATWKDADGNVLGTSIVRPGKTAIAPADLGYVTIVDKWVSAIPTEWEESLLVPADATEITFNAKKGGAMDIFADVEMLFNIRVQSHNQVNFYVPFETDEIEIVSAYIGATIRYGEYIDNGATKFQNWSINKVAMANGDYHCMSAWPGVITAAKSEWAGKVTFIYNETEYTFTATTSMAKYADTVVNGNLGFSEEAKDLVINSANYIVEAFDYYYTDPAANETAVTKQLRALVEANKSRIIAPADSELVVPNTEAMAKYISGVSMTINTSTPAYRFYLTDAAKAEGVKVTLDGWNSKMAADGSYIETTGGAAISAFDSVTITVDDNGTKTTLKYSVANYIKALEGNKCVDLLYAIYGYIKADKNY